MNSGKVRLGDNTKYDAMNVGNVRIRMNKDIVRTLTGVKHVLKLKKNLVSLSSLD